MAGLTVALVLTAGAAVSGVLTIRAQFAGRRRQVYLFKPLTTGLILLAALAMQPPVSVRYQVLIVLGLACSLAGDVFLMLPQDRFVAGMASFFAAHLFYIVAFVGRSGFVAEPVGLFLLGLFGVSFTARLWPHLGALRLPVVAYIVAILVMAWQAVGQWRITGTLGALLAALGALSFVVSDAALASNRFQRPFRASPAVVLGTYYLAQALIAWSIRSWGAPGAQ